MVDEIRAQRDDLNPEEEGDAEGAPEAAEGGGGFGKKKILLLTLIPVLVLMLGGGAAWYMGYLDKFLHKKLDCSHVAEGDKNYEACLKQIAQGHEAQGPGVFVDVPDLLVNLNSTSRQPRFLKISLKVELENKDDEKTFETIMPRVIDQFQTYLRELRLEDLRGSSGMYRMKIELLSRVRAAAPGIKVRDVLFQEILVQ
ncbi:MAG: flagellar basal body protein FliL [Alphaproteobacteria bacterium]|nr:flagellar basal body protein FliL [Alphaproteobacteria bacterium]